MADETYSIRLNFAADLPSQQAAAMTPRGLSSFFTGFLTSVVYALFSRAPAVQTVVHTKIVTVTKTVTKYVKVHDMKTLQALNHAKRVIQSQRQQIQNLNQQIQQAQAAAQNALQQLAQQQQTNQVLQSQINAMQQQLLGAVQQIQHLQQKLDQTKRLLKRTKEKWAADRAVLWQLQDLQKTFAQIQQQWKAMGHKHPLRAEEIPMLLKMMDEQVQKMKAGILRNLVYSRGRDRLDPTTEFIRISDVQRNLAQYPGARGTMTGGLRYEHTRGSYVSTFGPEEARAFEAIKKITEIVNKDKARYAHLIRFGLPRYFYHYGRIDPSTITKEFVDQLQKMTVDTLGIQILKSIGGLTNKYGKLRDAVVKRIEEINQTFTATGAAAPPPINPVVPPELVNLFNQSKQIASQTEQYLIDMRDTRIHYELKARLQSTP